MLPGITELPCVTASAPEVRRWLRKLLGHEHPALDDVELMVCELVTNSITHTDSAMVCVAVAPAGERRLRVEVTDAGHPGDRPHLSDAADGLAESGRGLHLVKALADAYGVAREAGQTVWFEVGF